MLLSPTMVSPSRSTNCCTTAAQTCSGCEYSSIHRQRTRTKTLARSNASVRHRLSPANQGPCAECQVAAGLSLFRYLGGSWQTDKAGRVGQPQPSPNCSRPFKRIPKTHCWPLKMPASCPTWCKSETKSAPACYGARHPIPPAESSYSAAAQLRNARVGKIWDRSLTRQSRAFAQPKGRTKNRCRHPH